ncbi:MAG: protein kinase [Acidobacteria bacterium]|nr:protein kinase [Acidobacteriota bacterium]
MTNRTVHHYQVLEQIGSGGMGVVYKARDTKLNRHVALKFLPAAHTANPDLRRRFHQEAQSASALGHPNILAIHDILEHEGSDCIVMEFVSGETLEQKLQRGPLRTRDALHYAVQIADALSAAHRAGVVHRDLKPANIMVTEEGYIKLLDFGLAKLAELPAATADDPTFTQRLQSEAGSVVGTAAYMSPEQAEGRKVDTRTDIFSFGAVLYEMVTGKRAFQGGSRISTMAAVIRDEPTPLLQLTPAAPRSLDIAVQGCLRKDAARRFQHISDVRMILEKAAEEIDSGTAASTSSAIAAALPAPPPSRSWLLPAALALLAGIGLTSAYFLLRAPSSTSTRKLKRITRLTYDNMSGSPALSPDGKLVAYSSHRIDGANSEIYLQQVGGGSAVRLTDNPALDTQPAFSADGSKIYFRSSRSPAGIYEVSALGGEPRLYVAGGANPSPSPDGKWIAYLRDGKLRIRSTVGGEERSIAGDLLANPDPLQDFTVWSPGSDRLLTTGGNPQKNLRPGLYLLSLDNTPPQHFAFYQNLSARKMQASSQVQVVSWLPSDEILFCAPSGDAVNLWSLPLTELSTGQPRPVTAGAFHNIPIRVVGNRGVFGNVQLNQSIWSLPADLNTGVVKGQPRPLVQGGGRHQFPDITPDGSLLSFIRYTSRHDLYLRTLATGVEQTFTVPDNTSHVLLSPDASQFAFMAGGIGSGKWSLYTMPTSGGEPKMVHENASGRPRGWSPDGRYILIWRTLQSSSIAIVDVQSGKLSTILQSPNRPIGHPRFSPSGRHLAAVEFRGAQTDVILAPFRGSQPIPESDWLTIAKDATHPIWSPDGNSLYYIVRAGNTSTLMRQKLDPNGRPLGAPTLTHRFTSSAPFNDNNLIVNTPDASRDQLVYLVNENNSDLWIIDWE